MMITNSNYWEEILRHFNQNGVTIFMSGFLFTLAFYHFLLYFQHKDKSYLYYSFYTFLIFIYLFYKAEHFFLSDLTAPYKRTFEFYTSPLQWIFNSVYLLFVKTYIDLKKNYPKWNNFLNKILITYGIILTLMLIHANYTHQSQTMNSLYAWFFVPSISILSIITLFYISYIPNYTKYYVLIGTISYIILATISYYSSIDTYGSTYLYYLAVVIESSFFALGLGSKQKKILIDKNLAQAKIIAEQEKNIMLKKEAKKSLDTKLKKKKNEIHRLSRQHKKEEKEKLEENFMKSTLDLRMKAFQTQMNPKFLFDSLNSLKHYIVHNESQEASLYLSKLSKLIRKILDNSQLEEVSIHEELQTIQLYMEVENMRSVKSIQFEIKVDNDIDVHSIKLPPLVLQPFIENAIRHGFSLIKENRSIYINISKKFNNLIISIEDNGIGRIKAAQLNDVKFVEKESLGIDITLKRIQAFVRHTEVEPSISFEDLYDKDIPIGTRVYISIPLKEVDITPS